MWRAIQAILEETISKIGGERYGDCGDVLKPQRFFFFYCKKLALTTIFRQGPDFDGQGNLVLNSTVIVKINLGLLCSVQYQHNPCP